MCLSIYENIIWVNNGSGKQFEYERKYIFCKSIWKSGRKEIYWKWNDYILYLCRQTLTFQLSDWDYKTYLSTLEVNTGEYAVSKK